MNLFSKEKGIIFSLVNAVLLIWIISAIVIMVTNVTHILVKDYDYSYDEYKVIYCNFDYDSEKECENDYASFNIDQKHEDVSYKRSIITSFSNVILVAGTLILLNRKREPKA